jgi:GH25 family lysozyme M1 (1,4-beta-N-acetylmuramidase)
MPQIGEKPKKKIRWGWLLPVVLLLLAVPVTAAVWSQLGRLTQPSAHRNTVTVNDGVRTVEITPYADMPVNELTAESFSAADGVISCGGARQGIDVSEYQGEIDWQQVADSGVSFVFVRLGYRGTTEGLLLPDQRFAQNLSGAREAGLDVGVYFFSQALNQREAVEEADYVLRALEGETLELPVMFDWEPVAKAGSRTEGMEAQVISDCAEAFCLRITASGYDAGIYFNRQQGYYSYDLARLRDYAFWVSDPNDHPDFYYAFRIWQYSFTGTVPGIETVVDRNLMFEEGGEPG